MFVLTQQLESPGAFSIASFLASMYQKHVTYKKGQEKVTGRQHPNHPSLTPSKKHIVHENLHPSMPPKKEGLFSGNHGVFSTLVYKGLIS